MHTSLSQSKTVIRTCVITCFFHCDQAIVSLLVASDKQPAFQWVLQKGITLMHGKSFKHVLIVSNMLILLQRDKRHTLTAYQYTGLVLM